MALEGVRDQPRAVALLRRALEGGRVAHAYAFVGPAGSGRMTTARAFAQALLCETSGGPGGCGKCRGCTLAAAGHHPDLHVIVPTPPERNPKGTPLIRIDAIREFERQASLRPAMGGRRVLLLDDADRMTDDTPQAFLKFLEEPPPGTVLILILSGVRAVPATVLSRCQIVRFQTRDGGRASTVAAEALALLETARADGAAGCSGARTGWIASAPSCSWMAAGCCAAICCWPARARRRRCCTTPRAPPTSPPRPATGRTLVSWPSSRPAATPARRSSTTSPRGSPSRRSSTVFWRAPHNGRTPVTGGEGGTLRGCPFNKDGYSSKR